MKHIIQLIAVLFAVASFANPHITITPDVVHMGAGQPFFMLDSCKTSNCEDAIRIEYESGIWTLYVAITKDFKKETLDEQRAYLFQLQYYGNSFIGGSISRATVVVRDAFRYPIDTDQEQVAVEERARIDSHEQVQNLRLFLKELLNISEESKPLGHCSMVEYVMNLYRTVAIIALEQLEIPKHSISFDALTRILASIHAPIKVAERKVSDSALRVLHNPSEALDTRHLCALFQQFDMKTYSYRIYLGVACGWTDAFLDGEDHLSYIASLLEKEQKKAHVESPDAYYWGADAGAGPFPDPESPSRSALSDEGDE